MARTFITTDVLDHSIGALSGMTYGTIATVFKVASLTGSRTLLGLHTSGAVGRLSHNIDNQTLGWWNGGSYNQSGNVITSSSTWYLLVTRKATGSVIPRASIYDYSTGTWTHTAIGAAIGDATAPGAGGFAEFRYEAAEQFAGDVAVRGVWSNAVPWSADTTGDNLIEAAGLQYTLTAWHAASPTALWMYDQADTAQAVPDLAGGGAQQSTITGTAVTSASVPTIGYGDDLFEVLSAPSSGVTGSGSAEQRSATTGTAVKGGSGAGSSTGRAATGSTGRKITGGGAVETQRSATATTDRKTGVGAGIGQQRATTNSAATKAAAGAGADQQRAATQSTGVAATGASGPAVIAQRSATSATGKKTATSTSISQQRTAMLETGQKSATGIGLDQQRSSARVTSLKAGVGAALDQTRSGTVSTGGSVTGIGGAVRAMSRSSVASTGRKTTAGAGTVMGRTATAATGVHRGGGVAVAASRAHSQTSGQRAAAGAVRVVQRCTVAASGAQFGLYAPLIDPVAIVRLNLATATSRNNAAVAAVRDNPAEAAS